MEMTMRTELRFLPRAVGQVLLAAALTAVAAPAYAQSGVTEVWRDVGGNWSGDRHALDPDGNLLVVGDNAASQIQVRKLSPAGQLVWSRIYAPEERVASYWIATDPAGNAWIAAARLTGSSNTRVGFIVLKYDPDGNLLFAESGPGSRATRVVTDAAGNAYVVGVGWTTGAADAYMVVKYAPDGRRLWTGFLESNSTAFLSVANSAALSPDQTRLVVAGGSSSLTFRAFSVALFNATTGQRLWNYVDSARFAALDVAFAPDGLSVFVGDTDIFANPQAIALHKFNLAGNLLFRRSYPQGLAFVRLAVDASSNVVATGTALPLPGSAYRDWMTIKTDAAGTLLWARRYDATHTNDEVPGWVTVDTADSVYVAGMGGPSPTTGNVSFLKPVTLKYDAAGNPIWTTFNGGDAQVTVDSGGSVFTLGTGQMTSVRFEQTGASDPVPAAPTPLTASGYFDGVEHSINLFWPDNATNEFGYAVERCPGTACSNFEQVGRIGENATGFRDRPLPAATTYTYRVRALGFVANSAYSNTATASTGGTPDPPTAPLYLFAISTARRTIYLAWTNTDTDATSITVERCAGSTCTNFAPVAQLASPASSWTDSGLRSRLTYRYRVYASNSAGNSPYSDIASARAR
jgi:hypothetical protein